MWASWRTHLYVSDCSDAWLDAPHYMWVLDTHFGMYERILFPTDGSEAAEGSFEHAVAMARAFDATLEGLYVINTTYAGVAAGSVDVASLREAGTTALTAFEKRAAGEGIEFDSELREGDPATVIVEYADEHADLIVMGSRGRRGLDRYLLGSVAETVVRASDVPVVTVRADDED